MNVVYLIDKHNTLLASLEVEMMADGLVQANILEQHFDAQTQQMLAAFQAMVTQQTFDALGQYEQFIADLGLHLQMGADVYPVVDLQVYDLSVVVCSLQLDDAED